MYNIKQIVECLMFYTMRAQRVKENKKCFIHKFFGFILCFECTLINALTDLELRLRIKFLS